MPPVRPLRVTTYNVRGLKDDRASLTTVIRALDPDVLLVQEAPRHPLSGPRVARFARDVDMAWSGGRRGRMSTTLLTSRRVEVHHCLHRNLRVRMGDEPRGFCLATVSLPGQPPVHAVSVHLSLRAEERPRHAEAILDAIPRDGIPVVVGGDLNETPGHPAWLAFERQLRLVSATEFTFPARRPDKQIDAVFASDSLTFTATSSTLPPDVLVRATDHLPVSVDVAPDRGV